MRAHTRSRRRLSITGARAAVRLSKRSAAEREKEGDAEESSSNTDPQAASGARAGRGNNCGTEEILHCRTAAICRHRNFVRVKQNVIDGKRQQLPTCELRGTVSPGKDAWQRTDRFVLLCAWDLGWWWHALLKTFARWLNDARVCVFFACADMSLCKEVFRRLRTFAYFSDHPVRSY